MEKFEVFPINSPNEGLLERDNGESAFLQIKSFIFLAIQALGNYYGGIIVKKMQESPGEIYNFILEETFLEYTHNVVLQIFLLKNLQREKKYLKNLEDFRDFTCEDIGIKKAFQLDQESDNIAYFKAINKIKEIKTAYSPLRKMQIIYDTSRIICECIDDY